MSRVRGLKPAIKIEPERQQSDEELERWWRVHRERRSHKSTSSKPVTFNFPEDCFWSEGSRQCQSTDNCGAYEACLYYGDDIGHCYPSECENYLLLAD